MCTCIWAFLSINKKFIPTQFSLHFGGLEEKIFRFHYLLSFFPIQPNTLQKSFPSHFLSKVFHLPYFTFKQTHPTSKKKNLCCIYTSQNIIIFFSLLPHFCLLLLSPHFSLLHSSCLALKFFLFLHLISLANLTSPTPASPISLLPFIFFFFLHSTIPDLFSLKHLYRNSITILKLIKSYIYIYIYI